MFTHLKGSRCDTIIVVSSIVVCENGTAGLCGCICLDISHNEKPVCSFSNVSLTNKTSIMYMFLHYEFLHAHIYDLNT